MKNYLIASRYAHGLSAVIENDQELEEAASALGVLGELFESNHDLRSVLANPAINADSRAKVLQDVLEREAVPAAVRRLAEVLLRRGRIAALPDVAEVFSAVTDTRLNRLKAHATTAAPLEDAQEARLKTALEQYSQKTVRLACAVDPEVLGGVVARLDGTVIDGTIRTRLERLRDGLLSEEI